MLVPLLVNDFIDRAELLYPDRIGIVDEPLQPAESWGSLTYRDVAARARAMAAGLDEVEHRVGERVAIVSHNSARLITALFGVSGSGRILVPINFRLVADEVSYIVEHCGARLLLVDPELDDALAEVKCERRLVIGSEADAEIMRFGVEPQPWEGDEDATATINYTSGTTARPEGRADHASQHLAQRHDVRLAPRRQRSRRLPAHAARSSTATAGGCCTPSPGWALATSCCARSTAPRSCAGSTSTASR